MNRDGASVASSVRADDAAGSGPTSGGGAPERSILHTLQTMLSASDEAGRPAVIVVDLDPLWSVHDDRGHAAGAELLEVVTRRLQRAVRLGDQVARIGGDEFLVLCPGIATAAQALRAATRVANSLRQGVKLAHGQVSCRASVGVAWSADPDADAGALIGQAGAAMAQARRAGAGQPVLYRAPA